MEKCIGLLDKSTVSSTTVRVNVLEVIKNNNAQSDRKVFKSHQGL